LERFSKSFFSNFSFLLFFIVSGSGLSVHFIKPSINGSNTLAPRFRKKDASPNTIRIIANLVLDKASSKTPTLGAEVVVIIVVVVVRGVVVVVTGVVVVVVTGVVVVVAGVVVVVVGGVVVVVVGGVVVVVVGGVVVVVVGGVVVVVVGGVVVVCWKHSQEKYCRHPLPAVSPHSHVTIW
jgi:hypothetical protein